MRYYLLRVVNRYKYNFNQNRLNALDKRILYFDRKDIKANNNYNNKDSM